MSIDVEHYRMSIGPFHGQQSITRWSSNLLFWKTIAPFFLIAWMIYQMHLSRSGDVESNPGTNLQSLSIGAQNVRSLTAPNRNPETKLDLISLMCSITSRDIFGISETWLDNSIPDDQILLPGFLPPIRKDRRRFPLIEPTSGEYICIEVDIKCTPHLLCFSTDHLV